MFRFWRKKPQALADKTYHLEYEVQNRIEKLVIGLSLNKAQCDKHTEALDALLRDRPTVYDGNTLNFDYTLWVEYIGDIATKLQAVLSILKDRHVVRRVSLDELRYGESLIVEVLDHIREIQRCSAIGAAGRAS